MKFYVNTNTSIEKVDGSLLVLPCFVEDVQAGSDNSSSQYGRVNALTRGALGKHATAAGFSAKSSETLVHYTGDCMRAERVLLVGFGKRGELSPAGLQKGLARIFTEVKKLEGDEVGLELSGLVATGIDAYALGQMTGTSASMIDYNPIQYKTRKGGHQAEPRLDSLRVISHRDSMGELRRGLNDGRAIGEGVNLARDLSSMPAGHLTPFKLKEQSEKVVRESKGKIAGRYYWGRRLEQMGVHALLAVARGSSEKPVLIELDYTPPSGPTPVTLCLVGKSITFDSGGLNLKPAAGMRDMKRDMAGGATVLGAIKAIAELQLPVSVKVIMAATENMPGPAAYKPGDVIRTMSGLTVEIDNTDAEGRLTLLDAVEFAKRRGATHIVDFATLTGAVKSIGGDVGAACFGNKREFSEMVASAGESQGELMINMPMWEELREFNRSDIADFKNSGGALAGSTTAAWLIREVAGEEVPWVHVDMAGVAYRTRSLGLDPKGASGYGVRTAVALADALADTCKS